MIKPFESAESAVQWYFNVCSHKRLGGKDRAIKPFARPCEANDIPVYAKTLLRNKQITAGQYLIFESLAEGKIEYVPYSLLPKWNDFIKKMEGLLKRKQIVNKELHYV